MTIRSNRASFWMARLLASLLAAVGLIGPAEALQVTEKVWITGYRMNRFELDYQVSWNDLAAQMGPKYRSNLNGDIISDDWMIVVNQLDSRCNSFSAAKTGSTSDLSSTATKTDKANQVLQMLKGAASQGGMVSGAFADYFASMQRLTYTAGGTTYTNAKTMTVFWSNGSSAVVRVDGATAAAATVNSSGLIKDNVAVMYDIITNTPINPATCPTAN